MPRLINPASQYLFKVINKNTRLGKHLFSQSQQQKHLTAQTFTCSKSIIVTLGSAIFPFAEHINWLISYDGNIEVEWVNVKYI